jgi:hypothetical protein
MGGYRPLSRMRERVAPQEPGEGKCSQAALIRLPPADTFSRMREKE